MNNTQEKELREGLAELRRELSKTQTQADEDAQTLQVQVARLEAQVKSFQALADDLLAKVGAAMLAAQDANPQGKVEVMHLKQKIGGEEYKNKRLADLLSAGWEIVNITPYTGELILELVTTLTRPVVAAEPPPEKKAALPTPPPPAPDRPGWVKPATRGNDPLVIIAPQKKTVEGDTFITPNEKEDGALPVAYLPHIPEWKQYLTDEEKKIMSDIKRKAQMRCSLANDRAFGDDNPILGYLVGEEIS